MKRLRLLALLAFASAMATVSQAAIINSVTCPVNNVPPQGSVVCTGLGSAVGFINLTLTMDYTLDVTVDGFNPTGSMTVSVDHPLTAWDLTNVSVTNLNRPLTVLGSPIAISATDYANNFQNNFSSAITAASFTGTASDGNVRVRFTLNGDTPGTVIPEPTTFALFGAGFVGVALLRRRVAR